MVHTFSTCESLPKLQGTQTGTGPHHTQLTAPIRLGLPISI